MLSSDSTAEATVRRLERLGLIRVTARYVGRTRASGTDGLPGRKDWHAGQFIYQFELTDKGKEALNK